MNKTTKNSVRIAINPTEIQNGYLLNISLQHQCYNILLSKDWSVGYVEIVTNTAPTVP
jgi:hypothetical protein